MERIYILLSEEKLLSSWQAACQALGLECAAAVAGENRKDDLQAALRSGADYILLPHQSYSPAEFAKAWAQRAECDCLAGTHGTGFSAWLSKMLLSYFTMRWLPSGAPAFVLIQADQAHSSARLHTGKGAECRRPFSRRRRNMPGYPSSGSLAPPVKLRGLHSLGFCCISSLPMAPISM